MCFLVKLAVLLSCVQVGEGRGLGTLRAALSGGHESEDGIAGTATAPPPARARRDADAADAACGLRSVLLQVRDLGLGYDSDEAVLFKYCSGWCPLLRSNHELTLATLLRAGALAHDGPWNHAPCCRPTRLEDAAFLDNAHRWHRVDKLSASACACVQ